MGRARHALPPLLASALLTLAGCGSSTPSASAHRRGSTSIGTFPGIEGNAIPAPAPTGVAPAAGAVKVIEAWSSALRRGDIRSAASYFQLPSEMINGINGNGSLALIRIRTVAQAEAANETLPCGARYISADQRGRYVNALFRLTARSGPGGTNCGSGAGETARTNFLIRNRRIVEWIRAPDDPGDNGSPPPAAAGSGGPTPLV